MYPLKMNPVFKDNLWGGNRLKNEYGKNTPYEITGESWEVASHPNGESTVSGGEYTGKTIKELTSILKEKFPQKKFAFVLAALQVVTPPCL